MSKITETNSTSSASQTQITIAIIPWEDVRHYKVLHSSALQTKHQTKQRTLEYDLALAMHANPYSIELLKHNFLLYGTFLASFSQQLICAMQSAIYPCCITVDNKTNKPLAVQNIEFITKQWHTRAEALNNQCNNYDAKKYIEKMGRYLQSAGAFFDAIKKDLLVQILFMPLYSRSFTLDIATEITFEWIHDDFGCHDIPGRIKAVFISEHICEFQFSATKHWQEEKGIADIKRILAKHYDIDALKPFEPTTLFDITFTINTRTGMLLHSRAVIKTNAGAYYENTDDFFIDFINSTDTEADENLLHYKTAGLREQQMIL